MPDYGLSDSTLATLRAILRGCPAVEKAVLYGSRAKGNFKPGSDIDLTLTGRGLTQELLAQLDALLDDSALPYQVDLSIRAEIDNPSLLEHIDRVGKVIYERST